MSEILVLSPQHINEIIEMERAKLNEEYADPMDAELNSWHAHWRKEALEHYLPLGWSFGIFENNRLSAFFLAQPFLFLGGLTQTLWVEYLSASNADKTAELIDLAYRVARDKHFQRVLFRTDNNSNDKSNNKSALNHSVLQLNPIKDTIYELKSAKF
jgi:hypothetical protein